VLTLTGRTDFEFLQYDFRSANTQLAPGSDCVGCEGRDCLHIQTDILIDYHITTDVHLPSVDDFPDLTDCERANVQRAIDDVLAPHEQAHVDTLEAYAGSETVPFDETLCRSDFAAEVEAIADARDTARQQATRQANDALDPFNFTFDASEGCDDREDEDADATESAAEGPDTEAAPTPEPTPESAAEPMPEPMPEPAAGAERELRQETAP
jgi:hypothetical protein